MPKLSTNSMIIMQLNPNSLISEAYRSLRFNIEFSEFDREVKTIAITSANRGEGKTTTALNLAVAFAQIGRKVILLDVDLRKPSIHLAFGGENIIGLSNFLAGQSTLNEIKRDSYVENLSIIYSGPTPSNPSELLASKQMISLVAELKESYDMVIIDTPPALALTDAKIMAAICDGVLLVVEHGKLKRSIAKKVKDELMFAKANLLGVVWSKIKNVV
ncbi:CpsD/CapB family tyrosine-protein kinase [Paenibacillus eucommiae]|uniref:non-specific protein-tyrosine kinase n=1 Tax=Paenibacillus eucommiae TaxID=1355755 RepID=A0ABS4IS35_9BACL|nr:CpsD/CapB family tyrosine-protein kinase [Paenibacillus eucommiae]MBP1990387.1 capsular exopolysaccharide synthesis family protein [Paenibacillus eucommiae]